MRLTFIAIIAAVLACPAFAQNSEPCACGKNPPGPPAPRSLKPYTGAPEDLRPFSKFTIPYHEFYQDLIEYNGAARDVPDPDLKDLSEIRIGFLAPLYDHPDQELGNHMLNGARLALDEANAAGGYGGKPFRLITHNDYNNWQNSDASVAGVARDSAIWGAASNDAVQHDLRRQGVGDVRFRQFGIDAHHAAPDAEGRNSARQQRVHRPDHSRNYGSVVLHGYSG